MNLSLHTIRLSSERGVIVFGQGGFLLHRLHLGAPTIQGGRATGRHVTMEGYILPTGDTAAEREASESALARRLFRICTDPDGFTLGVGERGARLRCLRAPSFSDDPAFALGEASFFSLEAESVGEAYFQGTPIRTTVQGRRGGLVFPVAITSGTVFGTLTEAGEVTIRNPGDAAGGFALSATAGTGGLTSFQLSSESGTIAVSCPVEAGETLKIDTRTGKKGVTLDGVSVMAYVDWQSEFFSLLPGDNHIQWESDGQTTVSISFTPLYL